MRSPLPEVSPCSPHPWHRPIPAPPQLCGSHHNCGDSAAPASASLEHCAVGSPWQMQCWWTVFTWPRRWSRASACPLRRGALPSYSRQSVGTNQHHPGTPLPGAKGAPIPSSHTIWVSPPCHSMAAVVGAGHFWVCWEIPSFVPLFPGTPSSAQHPVATSLPTAWQGHTSGKEQGLSVSATLRWP